MNIKNLKNDDFSKYAKSINNYIHKTKMNS